MFATFLHYLVNNVWEQVSEQFLGSTREHYFRIVLEIVLKSSSLASITRRLQNSPGNRLGNSYEKHQVFGATSQSSYKLSSWLNKNLWSCICFTFGRSFLICQLEGLDLSFIFKWFFFFKYFRRLSQISYDNKVFRVFLSPELQKWFSRLFSLFMGWRFL